MWKVIPIQISRFQYLPLRRRAANWNVTCDLLGYCGHAHTHAHLSLPVSRSYLFVIHVETVLEVELTSWRSSVASVTNMDPYSNPSFLMSFFVKVCFLSCLQSKIKAIYQTSKCQYFYQNEIHSSVKKNSVNWTRI